MTGRYAEPLNRTFKAAKIPPAVDLADDQF